MEEDGRRWSIKEMASKRTESDVAGLDVGESSQWQRKVVSV